MLEAPGGWRPPTVIHDLERFLEHAGHDCGDRAAARIAGNGCRASFMPSMRSQPSGLGDPRTLSGGIGEALIHHPPRALTVAIPSLIAYRFLRGKVERFGDSHGKEAMTELVDAWTRPQRCRRSDELAAAPPRRSGESI